MGGSRETQLLAAGANRGGRKRGLVDADDEALGAAGNVRNVKAEEKFGGAVWLQQLVEALFGDPAIFVAAAVDEVGIPKVGREIRELRGADSTPISRAR